MIMLLTVFNKAEESFHYKGNSKKHDWLKIENKQNNVIDLLLSSADGELLPSIENDVH